MPENSYQDSKVLIIDDEINNVRLLETTLKNEGFPHIISITNPQEAASTYQTLNPDLVLLDLRMPEMDGFQVLEQIKSIETDSYAPVIILTADTDHKVKLKALKAGAKDFLLKPLDLAEVVSRCKNMLEVRVLHNQLKDQNEFMEQRVQERTVELKAINEQLLNEVGERKQIEKLLESQNRLLEIIAKGQPLQTIMNILVEFIENRSNGKCFIFLFDADSQDWQSVFTSDPKSPFDPLLDRFPLSKREAFQNISMPPGDSVYVMDISKSEHWADVMAPLENQGLTASWSIPIRGSDDTLYGCLAVLYRDLHHPKSEGLRWMEGAARIAGIAIERTRAEQELKRVNDQLLHSEKLSAIGQISASLSHEFNNPIMGIRNILEQLSRQDKVEGELQELTLLAIGECTRVMDLARQLKDFYSPTSGKVAPLDLPKAVDDMMRLMEKKFLSKNIDLVQQYEENLPKPEVVEDQIKQVLFNLLKNAEESITTNKGEVSVVLKTDGNHVVIEIKDTGLGISPDKIANIFDPFYTTKSAVKGTGLGLSVSYGIVKKHGGQIDCESSPGQGTRFTVSLPLQSKVS